MGLRKCEGKPNCFSTTGDTLLEDRIQTGVDTLIKPWKPPAGDGAPFKTLVKAVKGYVPGQGRIDGGGFKVVKETDNYLYVIFESLKKGYMDDVDVKKILAFEAGLHQFLKTSHAALLSKIESSKALDKDAEAEMQSAIVAFKKTFA